MVAQVDISAGFGGVIIKMLESLAFVSTRR